MARLSSGSPLKGARGRIGNIVTYDLNGVQVARALPDRSRKRKASPLEEINRNNFLFRHAVAKTVKHSLIDRIWSKQVYIGGMNPYNSFISANKSAFGTDMTIAFPELMVLSVGNLRQVQDLQVSRVGELLEFRWKALFSIHSSQEDLLNLVLVSRDKLEVFPTLIKREEEFATLKLQNDASEGVKGYLFWSSVNDRNFSPSMFWKYSPVLG
ncbi:MAG: hypothetical protein HC905_21700 [Bacteroidales bacterium]|nr:hypothetical protein [Bacteroidales bacterium]